MRKTAVISLACLFLAVYSYSADIQFTFDQKGDLETMIDAIRHSQFVPEVVPPIREKEGPRNWTVMVFINAKNDMESYGLQDVNEMETIGSGDDINVVAELGRMDGFSYEDGDWKGSRRYLVRKDDNPGRITSPVAMDIPKSDMGDWNYLVEFVKWAQTYYPARKYVLIISDRGSGWMRDLTHEKNKGISYDEETGHHITFSQLRLAFEKTGKIDIISLDAPLMQSIEVAYELKDAADYIVASEETEPVEGHTYEKLLGPFVSDPGMDAGELSKLMVDSYITPYQEIGRGAVHSSIRTAKLSSLPAKVNAFIEALITRNDITNARKAGARVQSFHHSSNKDMANLAQLVAKSTQVPDVKDKAESLVNFIEIALVYRNGASGSKYNNACGLAAYLSSSASYGGMWAEDSRWGELMDWMK
ncbi:MAG: hypothetical protein COT17_06015 [Elusimicrobia bacterium CG08_land_8_20_14_0_20_51_18]|nr:MAG: hypothetical protein COT17_06015 [Elusimicrobia bacterium CG08_land_8_20_14_0_20_51_18]